MVRQRSVARRWLAVVLIGSACHDDTVIVGRGAPDASARARAGSSQDAAAPSDQTTDAASAPTDAAVSAQPAPALAPLPRAIAWEIEPTTRDQFCAGQGSAVRSHNDCTPIERRLFPYALCTCDAAAFAGDAFSVDSFDSSQGPYVSGVGGAAVGINGALRPEADVIQIGGSLILAGSEPVVIGGSRFEIRGDLQSAAPLAVSSLGMRIARDAWLSADLTNAAAESITVGGTAHLKPGVMGAQALRGRIARPAEDFALRPPCACEDSALLDIRGLVAQAQAYADNAAAGFSMDSLRQRIDTNIIPLPCGRLLLSELTIPVGTIALSVTGRSALFVDGDVDIVGTFGIQIAEGAELDLFVAGDVRIQGSASFGDSARPGALRVYVAGQLSVPSRFALAGGLYAPRASLGPVTLDSYGSIFVGSLSTSGSQQLHYDRALLNAPAACSSAGQACTSCDGCADGLACVGGNCSACKQDADCCAPLTCMAGRCSALLVSPP